MDIQGFARRTLRRTWGIILLALAAALLIAGVVLAEDTGPADIGPMLARWVLASAGGSASSDTGSIRLEGTFGQPVTGQSNAGTTALSAGFWGGFQENYPLFLPAVTK